MTHKHTHVYLCIDKEMIVRREKARVKKKRRSRREKTRVRRKKTRVRRETV